MELKTL